MNEPPDTAGMLANLQRTVNALNTLTPHQIQHLQDVTEAVLRCFVDDDAHGILLVGRKDDTKINFYAINANEMDCAALLTAADNYTHYRVLDGAPPKEQMN